MSPRESSVVIRYCPRCGRKVEFHDSGKRRQNANGRNIYKYAIFKCARDHTWNRFIGRLKASVGNGDVT